MTIQKLESTGVVRPKPWTLYLRSSLLWQALRFIIINVRMVVMIVKSHQRSRAPGRLPRAM